MNKVKCVLNYLYKQIINIVKLCTGLPVTSMSFGSQTLDIDDVKLARKLLKDRKGWFDKSIVKDFETAFAKWNGSKYAFSFMGGRVALSACIYAMDLNPGDEVILPGYTCVVVPNAFIFEGINVVYCDIELDTYGIDVSLLKDKITPKTKAILLHHLYGMVCRDYESVIALAKKYGLYVIEDCAQSTGAVFKNLKVGNFGDIAIYSMEQSKVFTTIQGGIAVTNNSNLASRLCEYYDNAPYPDETWIEKLLYNVIVNYYVMKDSQRWWRGELYHLKYWKKILVSTTKEEESGVKPKNYGCKMPSAVAILGLNQLKKIDKYNQKRRKNVYRWENWCEKHNYKKPVIVPNSVPVYLRYPVMVEHGKKKDVSWAHKELNVRLGVWFVSNLHPTDRTIKGCPLADQAVQQCINFPCL